MSRPPRFSSAGELARTAPEPAANRRPGLPASGLRVLVLYALSLMVAKELGQEGVANFATLVSQTVSATVPDWQRESRASRWGWEPGRQLLAAIRAYQRYASETSGRGAKLLRKEAVARHRFWSAVTGADIPLNAKLGGGLLLPHPNGIVIHPEAVVGPNCLLFQQVTLGRGPVPGYPVLEGHVDVGAGAKILGGVRIGAHAIIGANAVVIADIPSGATAVGVPARVIKSRASGSEAR